MLRVGVISYLPDSDIRSERVNVVHDTLKYLRSMIPSKVHIDIVAQNYNDVDVITLPGLQYNFHREGIGKEAARNILLKDFYDSDDDFMLYSDDDTTCHSNYHAAKLFSVLHSKPHWFENIDCFTTIHPHDSCYNQLEQNRRNADINTNWIFRPMHFNYYGEFKVLRNLKKYYGKEFYYDSGEKYCEDVHFRMTKLTQINSFTCCNLFPRNKGIGLSTLNQVDHDERQSIHNFEIHKMYKQIGVPPKVMPWSGKQFWYMLTPIYDDWNFSQFECKIPYIAININDGSRKTRSR